MGSIWGRTVINWEVDFLHFLYYFKFKWNIKMISNLNLNLKNLFLLTRKQPESPTYRSSSLNVFFPRFDKNQISKRFSFIHTGHSCILVKPAQSHWTPNTWVWRISDRSNKGSGLLWLCSPGYPEGSGNSGGIPQEVWCQVLPWLPPLLQSCVTILWSTPNIRGFIISTSASPRSRHKTSLFFLI